jgi:hypothetical protein
MFAILCAESVLKYFENKYPKDNRPRRAIEAAKGYLKHPTARAARAAADAAYAARAAYMAYAADNAADAAARAAYTAYAAYAAARAAYTARAAYMAYAAYAAARAAYTAYAEIDFALLVDMAVELIMNPKKKPKKLVKAKK